MAAPVESYVQLPTDTSNTGKKNRTNTKVVGANTVHEHLVIPDLGYTRTGRYVYSSTGAAVQATSHVGTTTGYAWLNMSTAATAVAAIRSIRVNYGLAGTAVASQTAPQLNFTKFTYNSSFIVTGAKTALPYQTTMPAANLQITTTSSGATVTLVGDVANTYAPAVVTTVGSYGQGGIEVYRANEEYQRGSALELKAGEGLAVWQSQAGTGSDVRVVSFQIVWDEIDPT